MKNYCHRTPRTYLSGLSSLKRDHIQLAFKKKTFEISGNYYKDDKTSNVLLCMLDIQNDKKIKSNLLWETWWGPVAQGTPSLSDVQMREHPQICRLGEMSRHVNKLLRCCAYRFEFEEH